MKHASRIDPEHLQRYIDGCRAEFEERLAQIVEIPTVSMDPERKADMERGAALAAQWIRDAGGRADVVPTPGHPVVVGAIGSGARRTLTIYNHLDVQPAQLEDGWQRPPFAFFKRDGTSLFCEMPVSFPQAALGATLDVPTLDGGTSRLQIPAGTQTGTSFRIRGQGVPHLGARGRGDLHVTVRVVVPARMNGEQRKAIEQLAKILPVPIPGEKDERSVLEKMKAKLG